MLQIINKTKNLDLIAKEVSYYNGDYPFSVNQLRFIPGLNLFTKRERFENQREFRLLYGGPNNGYKTLSTDTNNNHIFSWNMDVIKHGTLNDLSSLRIQ